MIENYQLSAVSFQLLHARGRRKTTRLRSWLGNVHNNQTTCRGAASASERLAQVAASLLLDGS